jgi:hypothetical protein
MFLIIHIDESASLLFDRFICHFQSLNPMRGWDTAQEAVAWAKDRWPDGGYALVMLMKQPDSK